MATRLVQQLHKGCGGEILVGKLTNTEDRGDIRLEFFCRKCQSQWSLIPPFGLTNVPHVIPDDFQDFSTEKKTNDGD